MDCKPVLRCIEVKTNENLRLRIYYFDDSFWRMERAQTQVVIGCNLQWLFLADTTFPLEESSTSVKLADAIQNT